MRWRRAGLVAAVATLVAAAVPATAQSGPVSPARDPFYRYAGALPLARIAPGTVLRQRSVQLAFAGSPTPIAAEQLLYRTTDELGHASVTVTTVIAPATAATVPRIVGYLSFYDGLGPQCDPSYLLAGGHADSATEQQADEEELLLSWYLDHGFVVTVPDFEGTGLHWMAGRESGYGALDAVRATEAYLHVGPATPVGLSGYSGGAVAADWASELAASYAPEVSLVGVAEGGVPVNYLHLIDYVNGTDTFSAAIPAMLLGLARAYHVDLTPYLSAYGASVVARERGACMTAEFGRFPGLSYQRLLRPRYRDLRRVPVLARILARQTMGTAPGHPRAPLLMAVGNADGRGDGVMVAADVKALAREYCREGVRVEYDEYAGAQHQFAGAFFEPPTGAFFLSRFAAVPFTGNCATL